MIHLKNYREFVVTKAPQSKGREKRNKENLFKIIKKGSQTAFSEPTVTIVNQTKDSSNKSYVSLVICFSNILLLQ